MTDSINSDLTNLINQARDFGLGIPDIKNAREFLSYQEYDLCFDIIVTQIYEYDIQITSEYYGLISSIGEKLKINEREYEFVKDLIE